MSSKVSLSKPLLSFIRVITVFNYRFVVVDQLNVLMLSIYVTMSVVWFSVYRLIITKLKFYRSLAFFIKARIYKNKVIISIVNAKFISHDLQFVTASFFQKLNSVRYGMKIP